MSVFPVLLGHTFPNHGQHLFAIGLAGGAIECETHTNRSNNPRTDESSLVEHKDASHRLPCFVVRKVSHGAHSKRPVAESTSCEPGLPVALDGDATVDLTDYHPLVWIENRRITMTVWTLAVRAYGTGFLDDAHRPVSARKRCADGISRRNVNHVRQFQARCARGDSGSTMTCTARRPRSAPRNRGNQKNLFVANHLTGKRRNVETQKTRNRGGMPGRAWSTSTVHHMESWRLDIGDPRNGWFIRKSEGRRAESRMPGA